MNNHPHPNPPPHSRGGIKIAIIVAMAENGVIGRNNKLPWYLPEDLQYFKKVTMGKPIIMGRKTFDSLKKPLPGRTNIVITRDQNYQHSGIRVVHTIEAAIELAKNIALIDGVEEIMVIGGAQIYQAALLYVDQIYLTKVQQTVEGDAYFPEIDWNQWKIKHKIEDTQGDYDFITYEK